MMSLYDKTHVGNKDEWRQIEVPLYGSDRVGEYKPNTLINCTGIGCSPIVRVLPPTSDLQVRVYTRELGKKQYELKDHLGNVRVLVSDRKLSTVTAPAYIPMDFRAEVTGYNNYYPFGMLQVGRNYNAPGYRFGYNGKESDKEIYGEKNSYDFGARIYDPRTGRWYSVDGAARRYPSYSPYSFTGLNPIAFREIDGNIWDIIADVVFIVADIAEITYDYVTKDKVDPISVAALSADVGALFVPFVTGAGIATRVGAKTTKVIYEGVSYTQKVAAALKNTDALRGALKLTDKLYEAHHIIPKSLLKNNKVVQDAVEAGFDFNGVTNGIGVKKFTKAGEVAGDVGQHANHPSYTAKIQTKIEKFAKDNPNYTPEQAKKFLEDISGKLKTKIQKESVEGGKKINDLEF